MKNDPDFEGPNVNPRVVDNINVAPKTARASRRFARAWLLVISYGLLVVVLIGGWRLVATLFR